MFGQVLMSTNGRSVYGTNCTDHELTNKLCCLFSQKLVDETINLLLKKVSIQYLSEFNDGLKYKYNSVKK